MNTRTFNESGSPTLLFVMGLGNRIDSAGVRWFVTRLTDAGYRVRAVQLPINIADFRREYHRPVQRVHDEIAPAAVVSHSLGGLVTAFVETTAPTVYLSPWWGTYEPKVTPWERWLVLRLPIRARVLPIKTRRDELGDHLTDGEWEQIPKRLSPVFLREVYTAQQTRPAINDEAVVFVSLTDTIVSTNAIGRAVSADRIIPYDGGHQLFSARGREAEMEEVLAALPG